MFQHYNSGRSSKKESKRACFSLILPFVRGVLTGWEHDPGSWGASEAIKGEVRKNRAQPLDSITVSPGRGGGMRGYGGGEKRVCPE